MLSPPPRPALDLRNHRSSLGLLLAVWAPYCREINIYRVRYAEVTLPTPYLVMLYRELPVFMKNDEVHVWV